MEYMLSLLFKVYNSAKLRFWLFFSVVDSFSFILESLFSWFKVNLSAGENALDLEFLTAPLWMITAGERNKYIFK